MIILMTIAFFIMCGICIKIIEEKRLLQRKYEFMCEQYEYIIRILHKDKTDKDKLNELLWYLDNTPF
jgi:hypothetical protein